MIRALILGASGYGGGELLRLLLGHPYVDAVRGTSRQHAGKPFHIAHPHLRGLAQGTFDAEPDLEWLQEAEKPVLFAAMPHGEFAKVYPTLALSDRVTVIDLSGDFRLDSEAEFDRHYKGPHPCPERLAEFVYGLADLDPNAVRNATRIANPGCFATACQLGLAPILNLNVAVEHVSLFGITGSSGSGMTPSETTHHPTRAHDFRAYKSLSHQHEGEISQFLRRRGSRLAYGFLPHSAPLVRGIFVSAHFHAPGLTASDLEQVVRTTFDGKPFVRVVEGSPKVAAVAGSNFADVGFATGPDGGVVMAAIDNLMKGMAGQAVQNMNLALGLSETAGLWFPAAYPG